MERLKFYDFKARRPFYSTNYKIVKKNGRRVAMCKAPSGAKAQVFVKGE